MMFLKTIFAGFFLSWCFFFLEKTENIELDFLEILLQKEYIKLEKSEEEAKVLKQMLSLKSYNDCNSHSVNVDNNFFLKDLNGDEQAEIIFNGGCKPYPQVEIFSKKEFGFDRILRRGGAIKRIEDTENQSVMYIESEPCCCIYFGSIEMVKVNRHGEVESEKVFYHAELLIPHLKEINEIEHTSTQSFILHNTPFDEFDEIVKDPCTDDLLRNNFMGEFKKGTKWIQFYELKNWAFGIVQPNFKLRNNKFNGFLEDKNESYIFGWIKK